MDAYCQSCGTRTMLGRPHWPGCRNADCPDCDGTGLGRERRATPDEVDAGCELGITWDPCPTCQTDRL